MDIKRLEDEALKDMLLDDKAMKAASDLLDDVNMNVFKMMESKGLETGPFHCSVMFWLAILTPVSIAKILHMNLGVHKEMTALFVAKALEMSVAKFGEELKEHVIEDLTEGQKDEKQTVH